MSRSYEVSFDHLQPPLSRDEEADLLFRGVGTARNAHVGVEGCVVIDGASKVWFHEGGTLVGAPIKASTGRA